MIAKMYQSACGDIPTSGFCGVPLEGGPSSGGGANPKIKEVD